MANGKLSSPRSNGENKHPLQDTLPGTESELLEDLGLDLEELRQDPDLTPEEIQALLPPEPAEPEAPGSEPAEPEQPAPLRSTEEDDDLAIEEAFRQVSGDLAPDPKKDRRSVSGNFWADNKKVVLVSTCAVILVVLVGIIGFFLISSATDPYDGLILRNVTVAGVNIGGMTRAEAEDAVSQVTDSLYSSQNMVLALPGENILFSPQDSGVRVDVKAAVKAAYAYGRTGSREQQQNDYDNSLTGNHTISLLPYLKVSEKNIRARLEAYAQTHVTTYTPSSSALEGTMPELGLEKFDEDAPTQTLMLNLGTPGGSLNIDGLLDQILQAYARMSFTLDVDVLDAESVPEPLDLDAIFEEITVEPVDSSMDLQEFQVIPGSYGYTFDLEEARKQLSKAEYGDTVTIPMEYTAPQVMEDDVLYQDVLGAFNTPHNDNENRNTNLALACKAIDGLILYPGDEFSYNETLGKRTPEKGYKPAPAYSGNDLVNSYGGGICQVSSTLYSTCLLADMEILDRINHGFAPTYMDMGLDATVSWNGPDFRFRNSSNFPIKLVAETTDEEVRIQILGTDERDYYIKMEIEVAGKDLPTVKYDEYEPGGKYADGQIISHGVPGYYIKTYRCKYDKQTDELISREYEASSNYKMIPKQIAVVKHKDEPDHGGGEEILPTDPVPTDPVPTDPVPTDPAPTDPAPTDPAPTDPAPTDPAPTDPQQTTPPPAPTTPPAPQPENQAPENTPAE